MKGWDKNRQSNVSQGQATEPDTAVDSLEHDNNVSQAIFQKLVQKGRYEMEEQQQEIKANVKAHDESSQWIMNSPAEQNTVSLDEYYKIKLGEHKIARYDIGYAAEVTFDLFGTLYSVIKETTMPYFNGSTHEVDAKFHEDMKELPDFVQRLDEISKSYIIKGIQEKSYRALLTKFESMAINILLEQIDNLYSNEKISELVHFEKITIDVNKMVVYENATGDKEPRYQIAGQTDSSCLRHRRKNPWAQSQEDMHSQLEYTFDHKYHAGLYGKSWAIKFNGQKSVEKKTKLPSAHQVIQGLIEFTMHHVDTSCRGQSKQRIQLIKETYNKIFTWILEIIGFDNVKQPFIIHGEDESLKQYWLDSAGSKAQYLILWLYTLDTPFHYYLNRAIVYDDKKMLPWLGPFALSLFGVVETGEFGRNKDKMTHGFDLHEPQFYKRNHKLGFFNQSFLLFRAVEMRTSDLKMWQSLNGCRQYTDLQIDRKENTKEGLYGRPLTAKDAQMPLFIRLGGFNYAFSNFKTALKFTEKTTYNVKDQFDDSVCLNDEVGLTLFVICMHNYHKVASSGYRLNSAQFTSSDPNLQEVLLQDGTKMSVIDIEEIVLGDELSVWSKQDPFWQEWTGQKINMIYLLNSADGIDNKDLK